MKLSIRLGGALVALVLVLVACTGPAASPSPTGAPTGSPTSPPTDAPTTAPTDAPTDAPTGEPTASPSPTPPPAASEGTLTIWADITRAPIFELMREDFTATYGVPVVVHQVGFGDIRDLLVRQGPVGEGPDIVVGAHDWLGQLATAGVVEPMDLAAKAASFDPVALRAFTYEGTLYGVPYSTEAIALFYNIDLMPDGNPPATWEELKQIASDLQAAGTVEQGWCFMSADPTYHSYPLMTGFGGFIFDYDEAAGGYDSQNVGLDSPGGIAYAQELDQLVKDGLILPGVDYGRCQSLMTSGDAAMWITGPWFLGDMEASGINFGVAPIPTMEQTPAPFVGVQGMMVSAFSPNKLLAQAFLTEYMATDEAMQALFEAGQRPPAWLPTAQAVTDENVLAFIQSGANGNPMPAIPEMSEVWLSWGNALTQIFNQADDPEQAIRDAAQAIREAIGE